MHVTWVWRWPCPVHLKSLILLPPPPPLPLSPQALVRRKVRVGASERDEITHLRVPPPPIPVSWGRTVAPYVPAHLRGEREMAGELR